MYITFSPSIIPILSLNIQGPDLFTMPSYKVKVFSVQCMCNNCILNIVLGTTEYCWTSNRLLSRNNTEDLNLNFGGLHESGYRALNKT